MPNWCHNDLYIIGKKNTLEKLKKAVANGEDMLSFRKIIPPPDDRIIDTSEGFNGKIEGLPDGYHWCCENWGTKWGACDVVVEEGTLNELVPWYDAEDVFFVHYEFSTAWSPPKPILEALIKKFPSLEFHMHSEEAGMNFVCDYDYLGEGEEFPLTEKVREASWYDSVITGLRGG